MSKKSETSRLVIKNLPYAIKPEEVSELHASFMDVEVRRGFAFVTLKEGSDANEVKEQLEGVSLQGRALVISDYEERPRADREERGRPPRRDDRGRSRGPSRSRSSSQGRAGPRRPRLIHVRSGVLVLRVPSVEEFLKAFSFNKSDEKNIISSGLTPPQPPTKGSLGFDPAILVSPKEKKAKSNSTVVIHKRLFAVTDGEGKIWSRTTAAKEEAGKSLTILQEAGLDTSSLLLMRFEGEAILRSLAPLQLALGRVFNKDELPMGLENIQQVTSNSTDITLFSLRKWNVEEELDE